MNYYQINESQTLATFMDGYHNELQQVIIEDGKITKGTFTPSEIAELEPALVGTHLLSHINNAMINAENQITDMDALSILATAVDRDNLTQ